MLSILIVDDEYRDRESMSNIIRRQNWNVKTYEAEYGQDALDILKNMPIDIMLTDIRMPDMLGTELAGLASELQPGIKIILISAYKDFDYAKQGIRFGAVNYLLKPYLLEDFINAVDEAVNMCLKECGSVIDQSHSGVENQIKRDRIVLGFLEENHPDTQNAVSELIGSHDGGIQPIIIECIGSKPDMHNIPLDKIISNTFSASIPFYYLNRKRCLIFLTDPQNFINETGLSEKLVESFKSLGNSEICVVFGNIVYDIAELSAECRKLLTPLEICFFIDHSVILSADSENILEQENNLQINALTEQIASGLRAKDYDTLLADINSVFEHFKKTNHFSALYVKYISANIVNQIFRNVRTDNMEKKLQPWLDRIFELSSIYDITTVFEELINELKICSENDDHGKIINRIYALIENEYMTDLNLETVANRLYISPSYLSHLFKKETGQNFIDYLKNYRLKKSCELLRSTNLRISQICNRVGYESTSYFCSLFKNTYGITPTQYRERGL